MGGGSSNKRRRRSRDSRGGGGKLESDGEDGEVEVREGEEGAHGVVVDRVVEVPSASTRGPATTLRYCRLLWGASLRCHVHELVTVVHGQTRNKKRRVGHGGPQVGRLEGLPLCNVEGGGGMEVLVVVVEIRVSRDSISEERASLVVVSSCPSTNLVWASVTRSEQRASRARTRKMRPAQRSASARDRVLRSENRHGKCPLLPLYVYHVCPPMLHDIKGNRPLLSFRVAVIISIQCRFTHPSVRLRLIPVPALQHPGLRASGPPEASADRIIPTQARCKNSCGSISMCPLGSELSDTQR